MATATLSQLLDRFNTRFQDSANTKFSALEKTEFLTTALADPVVAKIVRDSTLTIVASQRAYTVPSTISTVIDLELDDAADGWPARLSGWEQIGTQIVFDRANKYLPAGATLTVIGNYKYSSSDAVDANVQEYVLALASIEAYDFMIQKFATRFLTNDASMGDLVQARAMQERNANKFRLAVMNKRVVAL